MYMYIYNKNVMKLDTHLYESMYPLMAKISKKYLCAHATSTSSERVFSKGGQTVMPFWASLEPATVEMLIFLSMNL